ncbi:MAG: HPF/RaiA family ribosome-associated protein [Dehalococcoidales bacterium]|nr:HPF/RaiA family ribosome-associated protein [Dehalococcoidales bacterium]
MQVPPEISYEGVEKTAALDELILNQIAKLEKVCNYIVSARIAVESYTQSRHTGNAYRVRIDIHIPHAQNMVVKRVSVASREFEPLPTIIKRAFKSAERQLAKLTEIKRREVKSHPDNEVTAFVDRIFRDEGYGFLRALDGHQVYFHRNSCLHGEWERLTAGTGVRYTEELGDKGPQASSIEIVNKPGAREMHADLHDLPLLTLK